MTRTGLNLVRLSAVLAWSIIPALSETVLRGFGTEQGVPRWPSGPCGAFLNGGQGTPIPRLDPLVAKISPAQTGHLAARFGERNS